MCILCRYEPRIALSCRNAMTVYLYLNRNPDRNQVTGAYPFDKFDSQVMLDVVRISWPQPAWVHTQKAALYTKCIC